MAPKDKQAQATPEGERIAKLLSRRGIASRREAERLIEMGEVSVNGKVIASPALNVTDADRIVVLEGGEVLEQGSHAELLLRGGRYAQMWTHQAAEGQAEAAE